MPNEDKKITQKRVAMIDGIIAATREDLKQCNERTDDSEVHALIEALQKNILEALTEIRARVIASKIYPDLPIRLSITNDPTKWPTEYANVPKQIGLLAITGDPLYWGHIFIALCAIVELDLDCVVIQIMGDHPHKILQKQPKEHRHAIARNALEYFYPLLRYTPLGYDNLKIGEENASELLLLNYGLPIDLYYIAGGDVHDVAAANLAACRTLLLPRDGSKAPNLLGLFFSRESEGGNKEELMRKYPFIRFATYKFEPFPKVRGLDFSSTMFRNDSSIPILPTRAMQYVEEHGLYKKSKI